MLVSKAIEIILYLGLAAAALCFAITSVKEYLRYSTYFLVTQEPITLQDLPTIVLCFTPTWWSEKVGYGVYYQIKVAINWGDKKGEKVTLNENTSNSVSSELNLFLSEFRTDSHDVLQKHSRVNWKK